MKYQLKYIALLILLIMIQSGKIFAQPKDTCDDGREKTVIAKSTITCRLTTPELRERKATVIASLKNQIQTKNELKNGYAYKFIGSDKTVDELIDFIKTERQCCDFFTFNLSITGDKTTAWLEITGPKGAKEFIRTELDL